MANYPPGEYTFTITGTVGAKSVTATFVMTLVDPCPNVALTINEPATFVDGTYILRDPREERSWDIDAILSRDTPVDCGPVSVDFFDTTTAATPVSTVFDDDRTALSFASIYTEDTTL